MTLLSELSTSARSLGNQLTAGQQEQIVALSGSDNADLAGAAARVAGALALSPSHVVQVIGK
ncbi:MAG: hypothetical protein HC898_01990 [Phycisphaerales bacterium]|nr:hypothetical protein [Phycisphaerales bacterium]